MRKKLELIPGFPIAGRPLVIAHRGASGDYPEHTPLAYHEAIAQGADGLECDIRLTADEKLICCHDSSVERTSNGTGNVEGKTLSELKKLDWGSWRDATHPDARRLLTFDEFIDIARGAGRPQALFIETKHPSRFGPKVEAAMYHALKRHGLDPDAPGERTIYPVTMSFSHLAVRRMRGKGYPTVMLMDKKYELMTDGWVANGASVAGPWVKLVQEQPEAVAKFNRREHPVSVWTVNTPAEVQACLAAGVDALTTNYPALVRRELGLAVV